MHPNASATNRRWQKRQSSIGCCEICGGWADGGKRCAVHAEKVRVAARNRYRLLNGIPLDQPVAKKVRRNKTNQS